MQITVAEVVVTISQFVYDIRTDVGLLILISFWYFLDTVNSKEDASAFPRHGL